MKKKQFFTLYVLKYYFSVITVVNIHTVNNIFKCCYLHKVLKLCISNTIYKYYKYCIYLFRS